MSHSSSSLDLDLRTYSGLWWHVYVCGCVRVRVRRHTSGSHGSVQELKSPDFRCWPGVCVCVCWRKMKVIWRPNHNTEARFKRRYLSSLALSCSEVPSATPPLCKSIDFNSCLYQFLTTSLVFIWIILFANQDNSLITVKSVYGLLNSLHVCQNVFSDHWQWWKLQKEHLIWFSNFVFI